MSPGAARLTRHLLRPSLRFDFFGAVSYAYPDSSPFPPSWGRSSAGRALEWHSRGRRFDPDRLHQYSQWFMVNWSSRRFSIVTTFVTEPTSVVDSVSPETVLSRNISRFGVHSQWLALNRKIQNHL